MSSWKKQSRKTNFPPPLGAVCSKDSVTGIMMKLDCLGFISWHTPTLSKAPCRPEAIHPQKSITDLILWSPHLFLWCLHFYNMGSTCLWKIMLYGSFKDKDLTLLVAPNHKYFLMWVVHVWCLGSEEDNFQSTWLWVAETPALALALSLHSSWPHLPL